MNLKKCCRMVSVLTLLPVLFLAGCSGKTDEAAANAGETESVTQQAVSMGVVETGEYTLSDYQTDSIYATGTGDTSVSDRTQPVSVREHFTLDYSPEHVEAASVPGSVNLNVKPADSGTSTSHIPGLRPLNAYLTSYSEKRQSLSDYLKSLASMVKPKAESTSFDVDLSEYDNAGPAKELKVTAWGPEFQVRSSQLHPEFFVEFSDAVISLAALEDVDTVQKKAAEILTITPEIKGSYTWNGTRMLSFVASEPATSGVTYTLSVNPALKSIGKRQITGTLQYTVSVENLELALVVPGMTQGKSEERTPRDGGRSPEGEQFTFAVMGMLDAGRQTDWQAEVTAAYLSRFSKNSDVALSDAQRFALVLNSYITVDQLRDCLSMKLESAGNTQLKYEAAASLDPNFTVGERSSVFFITLAEKPPVNDCIVITLATEDGGTVSQQKLYTQKPFQIESVKISGDQILVQFNQNVDGESFRNGIDAEGITLTENNMDYWRKTGYIRYIACKPGSKGTITISTRIKSQSGEPLKEAHTVEWTGRDYQGYVNYLDSGPVMLESQFPHKTLFEYMNAGEKSRYLLRVPSDPLESLGEREVKNLLFKGSTKNLDVSKRNVRMFEEIDLEPYLVNGKGVVQLLADVEYDYTNYNNKRETTNSTNCTTIQVTDLAATVRLGINKAVVMVRSLSTGKPVAGAQVSFTIPNAGFTSDVIKTDDAGLAVISVPEDRVDQIFNAMANNRNTAPRFKVSYEDDTIQFNLKGHSPWRSNVASSSLGYAVKRSIRTYLFTDRGLYRPGETVTFRGILKEAYLGVLSPVHATTRIVFKKDSWRDSTELAVLTQTTSESGGIFGSFTVPSDVEPGDYLISVSVNGKTVKNLSVTVAQFEELKIQSKLTMTDHLLKSGDQVTASYEASYLAGGYLAGCQYTATWFRQPTRFEPESRKFDGFSFSIADTYGYQDYIKETSGVLDNTGSVRVSCDTVAELKPVPYTYTLNVSATDVSNQRISAGGTVTVHPADFYIGIGRPEKLKGFAKKGEPLSFPVVLVTPDEAVLSDMNTVSGNLKFSLSREYWTCNNQQSVNDSVYERWEKQTDVEATGEMTAKATQLLTLVPENAGWYTLRLEGTDSSQRTAVSEYQLYVTGSGATWGGSSSELISLTPDQSMYNAGDTAQILMQSPLPSGDYLITVEREGIFSQEIRHFDESCGVIEIPVARNYLPAVYVSVSSYSDRLEAPTHEYGERDMGKPKGYYGVCELRIDPRARAFSIAVETDKEVYRPGDQATVTLRATRGGDPVSGAEISVMGVDRAVLDLINYHVPDPIGFFYNTGNYPLYVTGGDTRFYLMDPVTYSIAKLAGGDADTEKDEEENERKDFRSTAFFEPYLVTGEDGTVSCTFKVPDNLSTFRVTAVGMKGEYFALQEDEFAIQNPVNVQAVQPMQLRVRDTAECGVVITNVTEEPQDVTVSVAVRPVDGTSRVCIDGVTECTVTVAPGQSSTAYFDVAATEKGKAKLVYSISCGALKERLVSTLNVDESYCFDTVALMGTVKEQETEREMVVIPGFAKNGQGSLKVTADGTQLGMLSESVRYVFDYPYGCMEQRSSRILPLILFEKNISDLGMQSKVGNPRKTIFDELAYWKNIQHANGAFPYWPENTEDDDYYVSLRIAHICAVALKNGYSKAELSINVDKLLTWIAAATKNEGSTGAYACYVFSLFGRSDLDGILDSLYEGFATKDTYVAAYTGLAYANKNTAVAKERAQTCASILKSHMRPNMRSVDFSSRGYTERWFLSETGIMAVSMQLLLQVHPDDTMIDRLLFTIQQRQRSGWWSSTATTAQILESIDTYMDVRKIRSLNMDASIAMGDTQLLKKHLQYPVGFKSVSAEKQFSDADMAQLPRDQLLPLTFKADGTGTLYYTATMKYALPDEIQTSRDEGMHISYTVTDVATGTVLENVSDLSVVQLKSGTTYRVTVSLESPKDRQFVAVRVPVPSGCEILNAAFVTSGPDATATNTDRLLSRSVIQAGEMQYFWNRMPEGSRSVTFTMRANRRGVYPTPAAQVECMYEPEIFGRSDGFIYTIE